MRLGTGEDFMGGFSLWHSLIVLLVICLPFLLYFLVRAAVRDGMKDRDKGGS